MEFTHVHKSQHQTSIKVWLPVHYWIFPYSLLVSSLKWINPIIHSKPYVNYYIHNYIWYNYYICVVVVPWLVMVHKNRTPECALYFQEWSPWKYKSGEPEWNTQGCTNYIHHRQAMVQLTCTLIMSKQSNQNLITMLVFIDHLCRHTSRASLCE